MKTFYNKSFNQIVTLIFKTVAMALSVTLLVLNILRAGDLKTQVHLFGIGLACMPIVNLDTEKGS